MNALLRRVCRARRVPLALRRHLARPFVPLSGEQFSLPIDGAAYRGRLDSHLEWVVWITGQYFEFTYLNLIRSFRLGGTAIDVGANVGNHTLAFSTMFDEVIAVEPYDPLFRRLQEKVGGLPNVSTHAVGFGSRPARVGFAPPQGRNTGTGRVVDDGTDGATHSVSIVRGDDFLAGRRPGSITFVKVDVEGYEHEVLSGLSATLAGHRPVVFYEAFRAGGRTRSEALAASFDLFPAGYEFWGFRGQTTFPVQRQVAHPVRITARNMGRRYAYVLATPEERRLLAR